MSKLFFIGAGKMATAIAGGLVAAKVFAPDEMAAFDISADAAAKFTAATGVACASCEIDENELDKAAAVLLAVKPQYLSEALTGLKSTLESKFIISIAAGTSLSAIYDLTDSYRAARVMPNTPALIGRASTVAALTDGVTDEERAFAEKIFSAIGSYAVVDEKLIDAATGLSGSGPAFVFEFIQALADGGVAEGLPRELALELAAGTVAGAAQMVLATHQHPTVLRDQVASPGGTTIRGLEKLARSAFRGTVMGAVRAAANRSRELGGRDE